MATSGSFVFNPTVADMLDEAFERCEKDPRKLTADHIVSARRSMNLMLDDWHNDGVKQWAMEEETKTTTVGMTSFAAEPYTVDIFSMVLERSGVVTPMLPIARTDYHNIHKKTLQGRPDRYFFERGRDAQTVYIWQAGENTTDVIRYWRLRQLEVVGRGHHTLDIPAGWKEAFAAGLAAKLAAKWARALEAGLVAKADLALKRAKDANREKAPLRLELRMGRR